MIKMYFRYAAYTSVLGLVLWGSLAYGVMEVLYG